MKTREIYDGHKLKCVDHNIEFNNKVYATIRSNTKGIKQTLN